MLRSLLFSLSIVLVSCKETPKTTVTEVGEVLATDISYIEKYRPQFHFSPPEKWMNDPNGLVYYDGQYHLFYQYYPEDIVWGPMHWGHAVSKDLVHWQHKPIALYPDELGYIFSGSAVVDLQNSSGFGTLENPPMVAIFTYHLMEGEAAGRIDYQTQGIAYSLDKGETWEKYEGNPVIGNPGIKDFRDPKVFWHEDSSQWMLILVAGDHAKFYSSPNLKDWKLRSEFGKNSGAHGGVWECPDLFKLKVEGTNVEKEVLLISVNPGAPNGGSGTQYFVGEFDGTQFTSSQTENKWIDLGKDNYAGVTFNNRPNNERIFIGWMSNWDYARETPTEVWRSAMTLPRKLTLHGEGDSYYLKNYPVASIRSITSEVEQHEKISLATPFVLQNENLNQSEIQFNTNLAKPLKVVFENASTDLLSITFDPTTKQLLFDRTQSGEVGFAEKFAGNVQKQTYHPKDQWAEVRIILDASSVEIFIDKGRYVFTNQIFPKQTYSHVGITGSQDAELRQFHLNQLTSIWKNYE
jgi:fructan beta-fructosidase